MDLEHVLVLRPVRDAAGAMTDAIVEVASDSWSALFTAGRDASGAPLSTLFPKTPCWDDLLHVANTGLAVARETTVPGDPSRRAELRITRAGSHVLMVTSEDPVAHRELVAAQNLAQVGSWTWDPRTDVAVWSDSMLEIYGLPPGSPTPSFAEQARFYDAETVRRTNVLIEQAMRTGEAYCTEFDLTRGDGTVRHVLARGAVSRHADGAFAGLRGTVVDITALHEAREALRASEQRFSAVMAAVRESVAILRPLRDADGEVVDHEIEWVNDAWKRIFGWVGRDPVGQRALDIRREFAGLLPIHRRVLARGGSEGVTLDLDGARWLEIDFSRLGDRLLAVTRDVTELRAAQERAAKAERHETLARLATGLAHEFNNQLSVLQGRLELLEDQPLDGSARDDLAAMRTATARVHRITETLVAAAQRQILAPRPTELVALVTALAPLVEPRGRAGVEVRVSTTTAEAWVLVDRDRLREAILELSRNVVDTLADDGVLSLRVGAETVPDGEEAWVVLDVGDATGAPSPEPEAVEAFGDVDLVHRLGLWGVVGLVRQSGGSVHTASTARGTSFRVRLPRMPVGGDQPGTGVPAR